MVYEGKISNQHNMSAMCKIVSNQLNWSHIPSELLDFILTKLSWRSKFRSQGICSSWLAIGKMHISSLKRKIQSQPPLLMLVGNHILDNSFLFNFEEKQLQHVTNFPTEFHVNRCIGSSNGWLLFLNKKEKKYSLFNPVLNAHVKVHNLSELQGITKIILWSDPIFCDGNNYGFVAIHSSCFDNCISYARCGENNWSKLHTGSKTSYYDIVCRKDLVYALNGSCSVETWDFTTDIPTMKNYIQLCHPHQIMEFNRTLGDLYNIRFYLIESKNEFLLVIRYVGYNVRDDGLVVEEGDMNDIEHREFIFRYMTKYFHVFKLDINKREWVKTEQLEDNVIFLGGNNSVMVHAQDFKSYVKNSIYFTDDNWELMCANNVCGGHDTGIYTLEKRSIKELSTSTEMKRPPFWIIPWST